MQVTCDTITRAVRDFSLVSQCDVVRSGMLRISTPFKYPNGSNVDLFLRMEKPLLPESLILSDYGQTADYLFDLHIKPWATKKRRQLIEDVCSILEVEQDGGQFLVRLDANQINEFPDAMVRLAQACIRIADLSYTTRLQTASTFQEEVEEYLSVVELRYEPEVQLIGKYGKPVKIDFEVKGRKIHSLVQTLARTSPANAHHVSLEAFTRWHDIETYIASSQFVTLYDSTSDVFRSDDLSRLSEKSLVLGFPQDRDQFYEAVAA